MQTIIVVVILSRFMNLYKLQKQPVQIAPSVSVWMILTALVVHGIREQVLPFLLPQNHAHGLKVS